jgi:hypothetical protein
VIVFLWQAGTAEGVTDDYATAQQRAASFMRDAGASTAVVEQASFIDGNTSLSSCYQPVPGRRWIARRHPGGRVYWEQRSRQPALTAA